MYRRLAKPKRFEVLRDYRYQTDKNV